MAARRLHRRQRLPAGRRDRPAARRRVGLHRDAERALRRPAQLPRHGAPRGGREVPWLRPGRRSRPLVRRPVPRRERGAGQPRPVRRHAGPRRRLGRPPGAAARLPVQPQLPPLRDLAGRDGARHEGLGRLPRVHPRRGRRSGELPGHAGRDDADHGAAAARALRRQPAGDARHGRRQLDRARLRPALSRLLRPARLRCAQRAARGAAVGVRRTARGLGDHRRHGVRGRDDDRRPQSGHEGRPGDWRLGLHARERLRPPRDAAFRGGLRRRLPDPVRSPRGPRAVVAGRGVGDRA